MKKNINIVDGNLDKVIWLITIPIIITNVIEALYGIIDSLFISNVGSLAVASVTFVGPIQDVLNAVGTGLTLAGCSLIANFIGAKDEKNARNMIGHLAVIGFSIGLFLSILTYIFADFILIKAGITEKLLADASIYLKLTSWGILFQFISIIYLAIERAQGNTKRAITINIWSLILKVIFCYVFTIYYNLGIAGIGIATILAKGICAAVSVYYLFSKKNIRLLQKEEYRLNLSLTKVLMITAIPLIIEKTVVAFGFVVTNTYVLEFGEYVLAAYGITNKVNSIFFKATTAFGMGLSVVVAQNIGALKNERAEKAIWKSLMYAVMVATLCVGILIPFRPFIAGLFVDITDPTYQHIINAMGVYSASIIPWAITECVMGIFQGTGRTVNNLVVSFVRIYAIRVPVVIIFTQPIWGLSEYGIWYAMLVSNILSAIFSMGLFLIKRRGILQKNKI